MSYDGPTIQDLRDEFRKNSFKNKAENTRNAIEMAYADMSRRQAGHTSEMKDVCIKWLEEEIFTDSLQITDFNAWHKETCEALISKMNSVTLGFGTVGKAQKVINMAFKYLSCITHKFDALLEYFHMTLDGYTLEWYKNSVVRWAESKGLPVIKGDIKWSKIAQYNDYMIIQDGIRKYLELNSEYSIKIGAKETKCVLLLDAPFESEFIIWEGNIIKAKYNSLIKALNSYATGQEGKLSGREKDRWLIGTIMDAFLHDFCKKV